MQLLTIILVLLSAHYIADFALQNDYVAQAKAKVHTAPDGIHALVAHSFHHFAMVGLAMVLVGESWLWVAASIGLTHFMIDYGKAVRKWYGYHFDQGLHIFVILWISVMTWIMK